MARELKPCGTVAAARRHQRADEPLCEPCKEALRGEKNGRKDRERAASAEAAHRARPAPNQSEQQLEVLEEVLRTLRGHLDTAPPQSVAAIAKQARDTAAAIAQLTGASDSGAERASGGGVDDISARRAARQAERRSS